MFRTRIPRTVFLPSLLLVGCSHASAPSTLPCAESTQPARAAATAVEVPPTSERIEDVRPGTLATPRMLAGSFRATDAIEPARSSCPGYFGRGASVTVQIVEATERLGLAIRSEADVLLAVRTPDGSVECSEPDGGFSILALPGRVGSYEILVGATERGVEGTFRLALGEGREVELEGETIDFHQAIPELEASFERLDFDGVVRGEVAAETLAAECTGFVGREPSFVFDLRRDYPSLAFIAGGRVDPTIVVRGPDGRTYCNDDWDDVGRTEAMVRGPFARGRYEVYVGTFERGATDAYVLSVSAKPDVTPATL